MRTMLGDTYGAWLQRTAGYHTFKLGVSCPVKVYSVVKIGLPVEALAARAGSG